MQSFTKIDHCSLLPMCGHTTSRTTVSIPIKDPDGTMTTQTVCEECYLVQKPQLERERLEAMKLMSDGECIMCGGIEMVRFDPNLESPYCDTCRERSKQLERQASLTMKRTPAPPDVLSDTLLIGSKASAFSLELLQVYGITQVLVCCSELPEYFPEDIIYHRLPMADSLDQNLLAYVPAAMQFIRSGSREGGRTLIHCNAGVSRSGALATIWIMLERQVSFDEALAYTTSVRPLITPNTNFVDQIRKDEIAFIMS